MNLTHSFSTQSPGLLEAPLSEMHCICPLLFAASLGGEGRGQELTTTPIPIHTQLFSSLLPATEPGQSLRTALYLAGAPHGPFRHTKHHSAQAILPARPPSQDLQCTTLGPIQGLQLYLSEPLGFLKGKMG